MNNNHLLRDASNCDDYVDDNNDNDDYREPLRWNRGDVNDSLKIS